jgi:beta-glucanase (GH16 family)
MTSSQLLCFLTFSFFLYIRCITAAGEAAPQGDWILVWSDEFDNSIDESKWTFEQHCKPMNGELQCYTNNPNNARVEKGHLVINVLHEKMNNKDFTSARLKTACDPDGSFLRGRFEMRAMLPRAKHLWPAFWLIPQDQVYGGWPKSGEIDIMEYRGQQTSQMSSALHFGSPHASSATGPMNFPGVDFSREWHTFALEWDEKQMKWFMDSKNTYTVQLNKNFGSIYKANGQPWDQRFHIIINVAVGGNFFQGYPPLTDNDIAKWEKPTMEIDYIRVYQKNTPSYKAPQSGVPSYCLAANSKQRLGLIIGVTIGGVALLVVAAVVAFIIYRRKRRAADDNSSSSSSDQMSKPLR